MKFSFPLAVVVGFLSTIALSTSAAPAPMTVESVMNNDAIRQMENNFPNSQDAFHHDPIQVFVGGRQLGDSAIDPTFDTVGAGICLDSNMVAPSYRGPFCTDDFAPFPVVNLSTCQAICKSFVQRGEPCVGIAWTAASPFEKNCDGSETACLVYFTSKFNPEPADVAVKTSSGTPEEFRCYRYTPTTNGCMVKKEKKFSYVGCYFLDNKECAAETLCVMNEETNTCAHVCDDKKKKHCKKPTFKGKKICKYKK